jgi:hypothetical protein
MKMRLLHLAVAWAADGARDGEGGIPAKPAWWWDERPPDPGTGGESVSKQTGGSLRVNTHGGLQPVARQAAAHEHTANARGCMQTRTSLLLFARPGVDSFSANSGALLLLWPKVQT